MLEPLKLRATSLEDLPIVSACLQDALVPIIDVAFMPRHDRFLLVANRFRWEAASEAGAERVLCGVTFEQVRWVKLKGIDRADRSLLLNLLTVLGEPVAGADGAPETLITLVCAGDRLIRLQVAAINLTIEDHGEPWPAQSAPNHGPDQPA